jgi:poly(3-hydroxybutyrate) depolymerase
VLFAIHGGPEGDWGESWSYRWNAQVLAGAGYVVVLPNPHGSIGYGQAFTDAVNGDWGGKPYEDIMATVDYVSHLPYVDADRMAAAGASYGGYIIDWILGHTDRFRALVSHAAGRPRPSPLIFSNPCLNRKPLSFLLVPHSAGRKEQCKIALLKVIPPSRFQTANWS